MTLKRIIYSALLIFAVASAAFAQQEKLHVRDSMAVEVHATREVNVHVVARHADGTVFYEDETHNLRTTGGADWQANEMGATSGAPAQVNYIALSNNTNAPAAGDCGAGSSACSLGGSSPTSPEITTNGCARAQATFSHSSGTNTWTVTHTWTATGTQAVQEAGMFNASSSGTMVFEAAFTQVNLANTDTLSITWTVSI